MLLLKSDFRCVSLCFYALCRNRYKRVSVDKHSQLSSLLLDLFPFFFFNNFIFKALSLDPIVLPAREGLCSLNL